MHGVLPVPLLRRSRVCRAFGSANHHVTMSLNGSAPRRRESSVEEDSTQRVVD